MPLVRVTTRGEIGGGGFSDAVTGYLQQSRGKNIRSEKPAYQRDLFSLLPGASHRAHPF